MKRIIAILLTLAMALPLTACGSKTYHVVTKEGDSYTTQGKPDYDVKTETYTFEKEDGQEISINREQIKHIESVKK
ncbi:YgdI/YgdR family lipoprotein [Pseudodesulfovibrio tunisiensis]|uniref:YgdI/YgdR family lipoprotein n=1 Tax=Pseudodesulfovibrio tunisiensis TaxID=463192 RepID=UPI001FB24061|nr:YgdI/YgdR family lipoprotein [Pseudodesulfovibrio tunisiensis]